MARARTRGPRGAARTAGARGDCRGGATATCFLVRAKNIIFAPFRRIQRTDPDLFDRRLPNKHTAMMLVTTRDGRHHPRASFSFGAVGFARATRRRGRFGGAYRGARRARRRAFGGSSSPRRSVRERPSPPRRRRAFPGRAVGTTAAAARAPRVPARRSGTWGAPGPGEGPRTSSPRSRRGCARTAWTSPTERCSAAFAGGLGASPRARSRRATSSSPSRRTRRPRTALATTRTTRRPRPPPSPRDDHARRDRPRRPARPTRARPPRRRSRRGGGGGGGGGGRRASSSRSSSSSSSSSRRLLERFATRASLASPRRRGSRGRPRAPPRRLARLDPRARHPSNVRGSRGGAEEGAGERSPPRLSSSSPASSFHAHWRGTPTSSPARRTLC